MPKKFSRSKTKTPRVSQEGIASTLEEEFQAMLRAMQTPKARAAAKSAFAATPEELGAAAVAAAKKTRS